MTDERQQDIARFRFSLIAPLVNDTYSESSKTEYFKKVASKTYKKISSNSEYEEVQFSANTIKSWYLTYKRQGFDALLPKTRKDICKPRVLDNTAIEQIHKLKDKFPYITAKMVHQKLIEDGFIKSNSTSLASVQRFIRDNKLKRQQIAPKDRKAFEAEFANTMWQTDTTHRSNNCCKWQKDTDLFNIIYR